MSIEITMIEDMVAADLELAYELLCNGQTALARHELNNALEKIGQIEQLRAQPSSLNSQPSKQPLLIEESSADEQNRTEPPATGDHPKKQRRET